MMSPSASVLLAVVVVSLFVGACASAPEPKPDECLVKTDYLVGDRAAVVKDGEASVVGLFSDRVVASFEEDGSFKYHMPILDNFTNGQFVDGRLLMKGALVDVKSAPIANGRVDVDYGIMTKSFAYSEGCSPREAALGAWAIIQTENENNM